MSKKLIIVQEETKDYFKAYLNFVGDKLIMDRPLYYDYDQPIKPMFHLPIQLDDVELNKILY